MSGDLAVCGQCGQLHAIESLELTFFRPDAVVGLPREERERDVRESNDLCVIRRDRYFIRATLPLPVHESDVSYRIGIWVEAKEADFQRIYELWDDENQADQPSFLVTLANTIPTVPSTVGLVAELRLTGATTRPEVFVLRSGHPLDDQQHDGITAHRAYEYTSSAMR